MHFILKNEKDYLGSQSDLSRYGCYRISNYIEIHENGDISLCCPDWLNVYCGNVLTNTVSEILNHPKRLSLIEDMNSGLFTECSDVCPLLNSVLNKKSIPPGYLVPLSILDSEKNKQPITINFSYDRSCNLQCPSCRDNLILYQTNDNMKLKLIHENVKKLVQYLIDKNYKVDLYISGSADAFASPTYWEYLKELSVTNNKNRSLKLLTNGILMTEEKLNEVKNLWVEFNKISVSIDAATEDTYKIVRKNGSFTKLKNNLDNLVKLINNGNMPNLHTFLVNFTVQKRNYKELKQFVEWQLSYNTKNKIYFSIVSQWKHITDSSFNQNFMLDYEERKELTEILKDPIFKHPKVICGNLHSITV